MAQRRIAPSDISGQPPTISGAASTADFQAAIDALPATGGSIIVAAENYSTIDPASLSVGSKAVTWLADGATLPAQMPGLVRRSGVFSLPETSAQANRSVRVHEKLDFDDTEAALATRSYGIHITGYMRTDGAGDVGAEKELRAYSYDIGTNVLNAQFDVRGIKGRVYAESGIGNIRAQYSFAESTIGGSHTGELTGLLATVYRNANLNTDGDSTGVRSHIDNGCTAAFQAASSGKTADETCQYGYYMRGGTGQPLRPTVAAFASHGGGGANGITNGDFALDPISGSQSTVLNGWQWKRDGGTTSVTWDGTKITLTPDGSNRGYLCSGAITTVAGEEYRVLVDVAGTGFPNLKVGSSAFASNCLSKTLTATGTALIFQFTAISSSSFVSFDKLAVGAITIDNVSVRSGAQFLGYRSNTDLTVVYKVGNSGYVQQSPRPSVSLTVNGTMEIEATSNTSLTIKYRGTDGTTRSVVLTLA